MQKDALFQCLAVLNNHQPNRDHSKHTKPEFKWLRGKKFQKIDIPNFQENANEIPAEEKKRRLKGIVNSMKYILKEFKNKNSEKITMDFTLLACITFGSQYSNAFY